MFRRIAPLAAVALAIVAAIPAQAAIAVRGLDTTRLPVVRLTVAVDESKTLETHFRAETLARVQKEGIPFHMKLQVPPGHYQLHMGVRDERTGWVGTVAAPLDVQ